jgi:hypothetical protein
MRILGVLTLQEKKPQKLRAQDQCKVSRVSQVHVWRQSG